MTLRIRHKVLLPALAVIFVLVALAAYSYYSIWQIGLLTRDLRDIHIPGRETTRLMRVQLEEVVQAGQVARLSNEKREQFIERYNTARRKLDDQLEGLISREQTGPEPMHLKFKQALAALYEAVPRMTLETTGEVEAAANEARDRLWDLEERYARRVQRSADDVARVGRVAARSTMYALVTGLLVSVLVWVLILWSLSRPLKNLVEGTERVAQGRFEEPIPVQSTDELGTLSIAFNRMAASLSELERMKAEFVATASHELKTPLACIKGFATLLKTGTRGPLLEEQRATLTQIEEQVDQMTGFVSQLLDLSRMRAGRLSLNVRSLPSDAFFGSVARGFDGVAERRGIDYSVRISQDLPARIQADPDRLREVVYNLLGNAFKFTGAGGKVGIDVESDSGWVRVAVTDTGPGISREDLPFIFEKYYRGAGQENGRQNEGAGLGLAISRGIVEKHGGKIWAESNPGQGSRFVFRIPTTAGAGGAEGKRSDSRKVAAKET